MSFFAAAGGGLLLPCRCHGLLSGILKGFCRALRAGRPVGPALADRGGTVGGTVSGRPARLPCMAVPQGKEPRGRGVGGNCITGYLAHDQALNLTATEVKNVCDSGSFRRLWRNVQTNDAKMHSGRRICAGGRRRGRRMPPLDQPGAGGGISCRCGLCPDRRFRRGSISPAACRRCGHGLPSLLRARCGQWRGRGRATPRGWRVARSRSS